MTYTTDFLTLKRITEPQDFIAGQEAAIVEFDDGLVRKLINQILVYLKPLTSNLITRGWHKFPITNFRVRTAVWTRRDKCTEIPCFQGFYGTRV